MADASITPISTPPSAEGSVYGRVADVGASAPQARGPSAAGVNSNSNSGRDAEALYRHVCSPTQELSRSFETSAQLLDEACSGLLDTEVHSSAATDGSLVGRSTSAAAPGAQHPPTASPQATVVHQPPRSVPSSSSIASSTSAAAYETRPIDFGRGSAAAASPPMAAPQLIRITHKGGRSNRQPPLAGSGRAPVSLIRCNHTECSEPEAIPHSRIVALPVGSREAMLLWERGPSPSPSTGFESSRRGYADAAPAHPGQTHDGGGGSINTGKSASQLQPGVAGPGSATATHADEAMFYSGTAPASRPPRNVLLVKKWRDGEARDAAVQLGDWLAAAYPHVRVLVYVDPSGE